MKTWLNSDQSIRRPALIAGAGALCLIAGFSLFSEPSKRVLSSAAQNIPHTTTAFFTIAGTNGMSQTGTAQPNDNGDFALPALNLGQYKNSSIAYTLELEDQNTDINFLLRYDHTDKNLDFRYFLYHQRTQAGLKNRLGRPVPRRKCFKHRVASRERNRAGL
jgi:hypothetical protein